MGGSCVGVESATTGSAGVIEEATVGCCASGCRDSEAFSGV